MKIPNHAVLALIGVFLVIGLIALPLADYPWRIVTGILVLVVGFVLNMAGAFGAGDAKFVAAAAPFIAPGDAVLLIIIYTSTLLGTYFTHRLAKYTPLRRIAPEWQSWSTGKKFPMGFALGGTLGLYLVLGVWLGS